jgi:DNA-binding NtrC family response regulator
MPLGSSENIKVDVRILAATNSDLRRLVEDGKFREDLYYRLNVINLVLPPLRERKEDIPLLVEHFFTKYCEENEKYLGPGGRSELTFAPEAMQVLMDHSWPGNVRELENAIERAVVLATSREVPIDVLPDAVLHASGIRIRLDAAGSLPPDASLFELVADFERRKIIDALEACHYSQTEAAEGLRIPLSTLNQKIKRLEIPVKKKSELAKAERNK